MTARLLLVFLLVGIWPSADPARAQAPDSAPAHGIAMHGTPLYPAGFTHLAYADPAAPRGGELSQAAVGSFDSLNPFIVIGRTAAGVRGYHFASLMARSWDEPFSLYSYVAETIETPADRSWVAFRLDPDARFHDGTPITVDDVIFSMETLREHGRPSFRRNYDRITAVERLGSDGVRFHLSAEADRETPLILGLMPIISRAYYEDRPFDRATLEIPLGSGPYRIVAVEPGRRVLFERVDDWWAADKPMFRGLNNFERLRFDYYRDSAVALEAFKSGAVNLNRETSAERWATRYDGPAIADGRITRLELANRRPAGMRGFVFNTRRPLFADARVRHALAYAFDFTWVNRNLLHGQYRRTDSYFVNSELAAPPHPPEGAELALLEPFRDRLPPAVFDAAYAPPSTNTPGGLRANLRAARDLLTEAGWVVDNGRLVHADNGTPFAFEILLSDPEDERVTLAFVDNLRRLGIAVSVRTVDSAQYNARIDGFDFDMIMHHWRVTLSPGAEQDFYWGSRSAEIDGTRNYAGVRDPVVDALIVRIADAATRDDLVVAVRALDRVLLWGHYVVPLYYQDSDLIAFWGDFDRVRAVEPVYGPVVEAWWLQR